MSQWIMGNIPDDKGAYYWVTVRDGLGNDMLPQPFQYNEEMTAWISFTGETWSVHAVVAYYKIPKPLKMSTVGNGVGFYIRTYCGEGRERTYGKGLQLAAWCMTGYSTSEKATIAAKRFKKLDILDNCEKEKYEIIDGDGNLIKEI